MVDRCKYFLGRDSTQPRLSLSLPHSIQKPTISQSPPTPPWAASSHPERPASPLACRCGQEESEGMSRLHFLLEFLLAGVRALPASQRLYQAVVGRTGGRVPLPTRGGVGRASLDTRTPDLKTWILESAQNRIMDVNQLHGE